MDYGAVLVARFPGQSFEVGDTYESIRSLDGSPIPPREVLEAAWPKVEYDRAVVHVDLARHAAYTAPGGADSVFLRWQAGDATREEWLAARQKVKDTHPYPPAPAYTDDGAEQDSTA